MTTFHIRSDPELFGFSVLQVERVCVNHPCNRIDQIFSETFVSEALHSP